MSITTSNTMFEIIANVIKKAQFLPLLAVLLSSGCALVPSKVDFTPDPGETYIEWPAWHFGKPFETE